MEVCIRLSLCSFWAVLFSLFVTYTILGDLGSECRASHDAVPLEQRGLGALLMGPTVADWGSNPDLVVNDPVTLPPELPLPHVTRYYKIYIYI